MKRILIVGSGIAGLAAGEIFARNGYQVVVAERSTELGGASSRAIQNWFHTGNLYLYGLPGHSRLFFSAGKLINGVYPAATGTHGVVNIDAGGSPIGSTHPGRWFDSDNPIYYCHAKRGNGIPRLLHIAPIHNLWFKNVVIPKLLDSNRPFSFENTPGDLRAALHGATDELRDDFYVLRSSDTTLYSDNILNTLIALCRSKRVAFVMNAEVKLSGRTSAPNGGTAVTINGDLERFDMVFLAAGAGNGSLLRDLGIAHSLRNLYSPILVARKKIFPRSFAIISPNASGIFHHILYRPTPAADCVSTISGCKNVSTPSAAMEAEFEQACIRRFNLEAQDVAGIYWGCKTEQARFVFNRSYASVLNRVDDNLYWMIPGKFSLFPHLVNLLITRFGLKTPSIEFDDLSFDHPPIGLTMVQKLLAESAQDHGASSWPIAATAGFVTP